MNKLLGLLLASISLSACDSDEKIGSAAPGSFAGEWAITYYEQTSPGEFEDVGGGYHLITIYNTSVQVGGRDSLWINDTLIPFKIKAALSASGSTLTSEGSESILPIESGNETIYPIVKILGGKVLKDGAITKAANTETDSIYYSVEFDFEPGTIYHVAGVRRTGFLEDDVYYGFE